MRTLIGRVLIALVHIVAPEMLRSVEIVSSLSVLGLSETVDWLATSLEGVVFQAGPLTYTVRPAHGKGEFVIYSMDGIHVEYWRDTICVHPFDMQECRVLPLMDTHVLEAWMQ